MAKYNIKSMAIGIGIGLILSATFNIRVASKPMTLKFLDEQAKYYGKVLVPEDFLITKITTTPTASLTPTITLAVTLKPTIVPPKITSVTFTVTKDVSIETVANWLSKDVIADKNIFLNEMNKRGLSTKILNGRYTFNKGVSLDELIKTLTGK